MSLFKSSLIAKYNPCVVGADLKIAPVKLDISNLES